MQTKYLIVGAGIAGLSAAKSIRKNDSEGSITMISKEKKKPYYRTKLTEAIASGESEEELLVEKEAFYEKKNIELLLGKTVTKILPKEKAVQLESGETITYEKLLLAIGASPFVPEFEGGKKDNMIAMRTMEDLEKVRNILPEVKTALVVGGGLLGLEAAQALKEKGVDVHVGEFADHLLPRQLDSETSEVLKEALEEEGMTIHTDGTLKEAIGDTKVEKVILTDGTTFDCQLVLFSVGVRSNLEPASEVLESDRGIQVNEHLETSVEDIWAAGDCAEISGRTMGLWTSSNEMGKIAGTNMSGGDMTYGLPALFTNLKIGSVRLFSSGSHEGEESWERKEDGTIQKLFFKDGKIIGGILYGNTSKMGVINKLLKSNATKDEAIQAFE